MFWAYMLRCSDGSYYAGHTDDLERRIGDHLSGLAPGYTQSRLPVELVWSGDFATRIEALETERKIKGWSRAKKEALIRGDWEAIQRLAKRGSILRDETSPSSASPQDERDTLVTPFPVRPEEVKPKAEPSRRGAPPIIVLVRPQLGENIGKAARAMLNFGLTELRLVAPRDGWPNPDAGPSAAGADIVIEQAKVFETTAEAVADCAHVYATTVRRRNDTKPVVSPEEAAAEIHAAAGRSALLFGAERSGLDILDVSLARKILTVPINPEFSSLNLAQAVILCAYEWSKFEQLEQPTVTDQLPPAPQEDLEGLIAHFEQMLEPKDYFFPESRADMTRRNLRNVLTGAGWNHLEVRTMRGVLTTLARKPR